MRPHTYIRQAVLVCALVAGVAACSSSSTTASSSGSPTVSASSGSPAPASSPASAPASTPASSPASSPSAFAGTPTQQAIAANWTAFFDPKQSEAKRLSLLENGTALASSLQTLNSSKTSALTTAKVLSVTVQSSTQATVKYDLLISGTPVLKNQSGTAVLQAGTWKVGTATLCGLLYLNAGGNAKKLPAACQTAG